MILIYDNRDDRREILILLSKISPKERLQFLIDVCSLVLKSTGIKTFPNPDYLEKVALAEKCDEAGTRLNIEIFQDLWLIASQYKFDIAKALELLVQRAKGKLRGKHEAN